MWKVHVIIIELCLWLTLVLANIMGIGIALLLTGTIVVIVAEAWEKSK